MKQLSKHSYNGSIDKWEIPSKAASSDSDHCPLILGLGDHPTGKRRFHFEPFWPTLDGFQETVETAWSSVPRGSCPMENLSARLKATAKKLMGWSQKKIGHVKSQLALAKEILHQLEIAQDNRHLSGSEIWLKNCLKKHTLALASPQRTIARTRSRINWLRDGDANTALFHAHARHRKKKNFISKFISDGQILTSHSDKEKVVFDFYNNLLGAVLDRNRTVDLEALGMPTHDLQTLDIPITVEEVWNTIKELPSDKAPGPDGFTGRFFKSCWQIIKRRSHGSCLGCLEQKIQEFLVA